MYDGVRGEARVICHGMDLLLYVLEFPTKGVDEDDRLKLRPVKVPHVGDARNKVFDLIDCLV